MNRKVYSVMFYESAERDLQSLFDYIRSHDSEKRANAVVSKLEEAVSTLRELPERCPFVEIANTRFDQCRKLTAGRYQVIFKIDGSIVYVYAVFDGRRNYGEVLRDRLSKHSP
ncbi:MAG: type II toxin-antitoxin system RelE/ParE family toxin [Ignavibacteria bacterium]|nr:type II toxin-antitoxin system RelE/ParE family toxin [Ignavibacteria bacterium]MBK7577213.1 type II toxin-antitoxin system RelE/ParE family toxin [Ignavibacteria bacterium]